MATLQNGGRTIAVIGTGLDVFIQEQIKTPIVFGNITLWFSEYGPEAEPLKFHFPERNRIIAGLCRALLSLKHQNALRKSNHL